MKLLSIALLASSTVVNAWWGKGHLLVSRMAHDILKEKSPKTIEQVDDLLAVLKKSDPDWTVKEGKHPLVECATFADDIKYKGGGYQKGWHFIDQPYLDQGGKISDFNFTADVHNITEAIDDITAWFRGTPGYDSTYIYQ